LTKVSLKRVNLTDANLTGANLTDANLIRAIFCGTAMQDGTIDDSGC